MHACMRMAQQQSSPSTKHKPSDLMIQIPDETIQCSALSKAAAACLERTRHPLGADTDTTTTNHTTNNSTILCQTSDSDDVDDDATASTVDTESTAVTTRTIHSNPGSSHPTFPRSSFDSNPPSSSSCRAKKNTWNAPLPSALRTPSSSRNANSNSKSTRGSSERRVRGLWKPRHTSCRAVNAASPILSSMMPASSDAFECLQDDTVEHIVSFLPLVDRLQTSDVSERFRHITELPKYWIHVDATEFVGGSAYNSNNNNNNNETPEHTTQRLSNLLNRHANTIESLTVRNIGHALCPELFCLPNKNLKRLHLDGFQNLSDTHWHVLLLAADLARRNASSPLQWIRLTNCPLLTQKSLRSIAIQCPRLQELQILDCPNVHSIQPLCEHHRLPVIVSTPSSSEDEVLPALPTLDRMNLNNTSQSPLSLMFSPPPQQPPAIKTETPSKSVPIHNNHSQPSKPSLSNLFPPSPPPPTPVLNGLFLPPPPQPPALHAMFSPPPQPQSTTPALNGLFSPPATKPPNGNLATQTTQEPSQSVNSRPSTPPRSRASSDSLSSLFLPPGQSPLHSKKSLPTRGSGCPLAAADAARPLRRLSISLTPQQVLDSLHHHQKMSPHTRVRLERLVVRHEAPWTLEQLQELAAACGGSDGHWHLHVESSVYQSLPDDLRQRIVQMHTTTTTTLL